MKIKIQGEEMKHYITAVTVFAVLFLFPREFASGFFAGLSNCAQVVIPSLFPFLVASSLAGAGRMPPLLKRIAEPITQKLFGLPGDCLPSVILGQLGGYLSGAKSAESLYSSGILSRTQSRRFLLFCVNPGVGFSVNAVGNALLHSEEAGGILLVSMIVSSLITGFFLRFLPDRPSETRKTAPKTLTLSEAVVKSVSSASASMLVCCGFVCFFSGLSGVIGSVVKNPDASLFLSCLLEVTSGCAAAAGRASLPVMAAVCAFGGLCVHMQVFSLSKDFGINIPLFYLFRILHSGLAYAVCGIILHFFPTEITASVSLGADAVMWSFSAPAAVSLLFLCSLLILELDNGRDLC